MKDKIFLCNDDKKANQDWLSRLGLSQKDSENEWYDKIMDERDKVVQKIEEKLNREVKMMNKEMKER